MWRGISVTNPGLLLQLSFGLVLLLLSCCGISEFVCNASLVLTSGEPGEQEGGGSSCCSFHLGGIQLPACLGTTLAQNKGKDVVEKYQFHF